ncbi:hypothetical protein [Bacillus massiliigorillae]|uniref:hypothetical protein n=1 Tax=Bacillus massiliigorillae TaxID=1243664 RepID=UPI0003A4F1F0|nr:hypothetical protein [Bacillus massiliigorillae]
MLGTVEYYSDCFKSHILNKLVDEKNQSLAQVYLKLVEDIDEKNENQETKNHLYKNLDKAFRNLQQEIFGAGE